MATRSTIAPKPTQDIIATRNDPRQTYTFVLGNDPQLSVIHIEREQLLAQIYDPKNQESKKEQLINRLAEINNQIAATSYEGVA
jgi:hypothetical protein